MTPVTTKDPKRFEVLIYRYQTPPEAGRDLAFCEVYPHLTTTDPNSYLTECYNNVTPNNTTLVRGLVYNDRVHIIGSVPGLDNPSSRLAISSTAGYWGQLEEAYSQLMELL